MPGRGVSGKSVRNIRQGSDPVNRRGRGVGLEGGEEAARFEKGQCPLVVVAERTQGTAAHHVHLAGEIGPVGDGLDLGGEDLNVESQLAHDAIEEAGAVAARFHPDEARGGEGDRQGDQGKACTATHVEPGLRRGGNGGLQKLEGVFGMALAKTREISRAHEVLLLGFLPDHRLERLELFELFCRERVLKDGHSENDLH